MGERDPSMNTPYTLITEFLKISQIGSLNSWFLEKKLDFILGERWGFLERNLEWKGQIIPLWKSKIVLRMNWVKGDDSNAPWALKPYNCARQSHTLYLSISRREHNAPYSLLQRKKQCIMDHSTLGESNASRTYHVSSLFQPSKHAPILISKFQNSLMTYF